MLAAAHRPSVAMASAAAISSGMVVPTIAMRASPVASFSTTAAAHSNIGRKPIAYDAGAVTVTYANPHPVPLPDARVPSPHTVDRRESYVVTVTGPLGVLTRPLPAYVRLTPTKPSVRTLESETPAPAAAATAALAVSVDFPVADTQRAMWGTARALLANMVTGVTAGHAANVKFVGVGYRASVENAGRTVALKLGFANIVEVPVPNGVTAKSLAPDQLVLQGIDKMVVKQLAATIRKYKQPEPFNQKGIFVDGETIAKKKPKNSK
ncbi:ribosomal protein L6, alpha-beta domain-containing protein [Blastocladiella britannica]|nr:ribosomal protein L6, alpha-beta domain-containing protein [Blastocladiella britannica]